MNISMSHNMPGINAAMRRAPDILMQFVDRYLGRGAKEVERAAKNHAPKADSFLTNAIILHNLGLADYQISAGKPYAVYVEEGRPPGKKPPPVRMIEHWIKTGSGVQPRNPDMDPRSLAYVISRSIAKKGIKPQPFMSQSLQEKEDRLTQLVRRGTEEGLQAVARLGGATP